MSPGAVGRRRVTPSSRAANDHGFFSPPDHESHDRFPSLAGCVPAGRPESPDAHTEPAP